MSRAIRQNNVTKIEQMITRDGIDVNVKLNKIVSIITTIMTMIIYILAVSILFS